MIPFSPIPRTTALLAAAVLSAACLPAAAQSGTGSTREPSGGRATAPQAALSRADQGMLRDIAQANLAEIATGRLALEKAGSPEVKQFAQQMIDDHGSAMKDVERLAQAKGMRLPDGPDAKHKTMATGMKALSGETFDKQYMSHAGVGDHQSTRELLSKTQSQARDPELKALAGKMLPVVERHLAMAQRVAPK